METNSELKDRTNREQKAKEDNLKRLGKAEHTLGFRRNLKTGCHMIGIAVIVNNRPATIRAIGLSPILNEDQEGIIRVLVIYTDHIAPGEYLEKPRSEWVLPGDAQPVQEGK
jgi:hypothetical protein